MEKTKVVTWLKKHRLEVIFLLLILALALFTRLYRIADYLTFLGDEGRDVRIVRDLLRGNLVFIGPQTSIGNMYLGPLYYYLIAPSLFFSRLNPVGPAVMVALLGTLAVGLTWFVGRSWFNPPAGLIAALLFALSPVAIIYSRSSWNPNPMPLFTLLCIFCLYQVWHHQRWFYLPLTSLFLAFALQMHYLGLLLFPTLILFWFLSFKKALKNPRLQSLAIRQTLIALFVFLVLMSPLLLFDLKHDFLNYQAFQTFFAKRQTTVNLNPINSNRFLPTFYLIVQELVLSRQDILLPLASLVLISLFIWLSITAPKKLKSPLTLLSLWLLFAILGLSLYKQHLYAHYFGFIYPAIYLVLGFIIFQLSQKFLVTKFLSFAILIFLIYLSLQHSPLKSLPNQQLQRTKDVANLIIKQSANQPFNFGLIAKQNYDESYRYFFENQSAPLVRGEQGITKQLFVVCEDNDSCQPLGHPAWQIAIFGQAKIKDQWQIDNIKIYQLVHQD